MAGGVTLVQGVVAADPSIAAITGGAITGTNVPYILATWAIPVGKAPSGTMANNGAVTFGTALPTTYSNGIWLYYPAGAVAAGVPAAAGFLWTVMSSTTVGTVYNSTYSGTGVPTIGTQTAFTATGPGAFTGDTTLQGITINMPSGAMGNNGFVEVTWGNTYTNSATNKTPTLKFGGTQIWAQNTTTTTEISVQQIIQNVGVATAQVTYNQSQGSTGGMGEPTTNGKVRTSINTANTTAILLAIQNGGAATDAAIIESAKITLE